MQNREIAVAYHTVKEAMNANPVAKSMVAIIEEVEGMPLSALATVKPEVVFDLAEEVSTIQDDEW